MKLRPEKAPSASLDFEIPADRIPLGLYGRRTADGKPGALLTLPSEAHYMLIGTTGAGKTTSAAMGALLSQTDKSFLVFDFKGSLVMTTARWRRTVSDVKIIDPYGITGQK